MIIRRFIAAITALFLLCAQSPISNFPPSVFSNNAARSPAAVTFQGAGDIVSGAIAWGSCARVYTVAQASTATPLCDLVAVTGGAAVCTLRGTTTGFVDLAASYCAGTTPALACAAASGGSCKVTKIYDQTGNSNHWTNATLASMPALNFGGARSLPGIGCDNASGSVLTSPSITQAQPFSLSAVWERTAGFTTTSNVIGAASSNIIIGAQNSANLSLLAAGLAITQAANDSTFHAQNAVLNGASSAGNTDGTDTGAVNAGTNAFGSAARFCRSNSAVSMTGLIMEGGVWPFGFNLTQRGNIITNQRSATNGYNF